MDKDVFAPTRQRASELRGAWEQLEGVIASTEAADGSRFDRGLPIPDIGLAIDDLSMQIQLLAEFLDELQPATNDAVAATPPMARVALEQALEKAAQDVAQLTQHLEKPLVSLDPSSFQGAVRHPSRPQQTKAINFRDSFQAVGRELDTAYVRLIQIRQTLPTRDERRPFPALVQKFRTLAAETEEHSSKVAHAREATDEILGGAEKAWETIQGLVEKSQQATDASESAKDNLDKLASEAQKATTAIEESLRKAKSLESDVDAAQADLDSFQKSLDRRTNQLSEGFKEQDRLIKALVEIESDINRKNEQASDMLAKATVAGLAASFGTTRDELSEELSQARTVFYAAIFVLVLLATPMVWYLLPGLPLGGPAVDRVNANVGAVLADVSARAAILLPGIWLVAFAGRRASALFRLREHYAYKYNMAAAVEGFKQQAGDLAPAIAAATFNQLLTSNPADVMDGKGQEEGPPASNPLVDQVRKALAARGGDSS